MGPWNHGGWAEDDGHFLGNINFDSDTGEYFRQHIQAAWFAHWLKNKGSLPLSEALVFQTGSNQWIPYAQWPPHQGITRQKLYLRVRQVYSYPYLTQNFAAEFGHRIMTRRASASLLRRHEGA